MNFDIKEAAASTAVVIRSYNNRHVTKRVRFFLKLGFGRVIVVVKNNIDQGSTRSWLKCIRDQRLQIIEMADGYHWATALNAAAQSVLNSNLFGGQKFTHMFNVSVEAQFNEGQVRFMLAEACANPQYGVVGTTFEGRMDGNTVKTGRSYNHPRNTGMICSVEALSSAHLFNSMCDSIGGMEDIDFLLKLLVMGRYTYGHLDLQVPLILDVHYNQKDKEKREQSAMDKIMAHWRSICPDGGDEINRIERAIEAMKLEEARS